MIRINMIVFLLLCCVAVVAQRRLSVLDMETHNPIADANVVSERFKATTDSLGRIVIPDSCKSLIVSHVNYESDIVNTDETNDTIYLLSKLLKLPEVVVFGNGKDRDYSQLQYSLKLDKIEAQLLAANPNGGTGGGLGALISYLLPKKWRPGYGKKSRKERLKEILDNY